MPNKRRKDKTHFGVWLSGRLRKDLEKAANKMGMNLSDYVVAAIESSLLKFKHEEEDDGSSANDNNAK